MPDLNAVLTILKTAKQETIDRKKCFVLDWEAFQNVAHHFGDIDFIDERLGAEGYNNFQIKITAGDRGVYYVVSKTGQILDEIWKEHNETK